MVMMAVVLVLVTLIRIKLIVKYMNVLYSPTDVTVLTDGTTTEEAIAEMINVH